MDGLPLYLSKPHLSGVDNELTAHLQYTNHNTSLDDKSYIDVEPILGAAINANIVLQTNFAIHNKVNNQSSLQARSQTP